MTELVMKNTYKGRTFWITKHETEEYPKLELLPHKWYCGYIEYEPAAEHDSEDFDVFGGITFVGNLSQLDGFNSNVTVIGFDTAHINGEKMTANDVREECFNLIDQIESLKERKYCNRDVEVLKASEKKYTIKVLNTEFGFLYKVDSIETIMLTNTNDAGSYFTQSEIEALKHRQDIAVDWDKVELEEVDE